AITSSVAGFITPNVRPLSASHHLPSMYMRRHVAGEVAGVMLELPEIKTVGPCARTLRRSSLALLQFVCLDQRTHFESVAIEHVVGCLAQALGAYVSSPGRVEREGRARGVDAVGIWAGTVRPEGPNPGEGRGRVQSRRCFFEVSVHGSGVTTVQRGA